MASALVDDHLGHGVDANALRKAAVARKKETEVGPTEDPVVEGAEPEIKATRRECHGTRHPAVRERVPCLEASDVTMMSTARRPRPVRASRCSSGGEARGFQRRSR